MPTVPRFGVPRQLEAIPPGVNVPSLEPRRPAFAKPSATTSVPEAAFVPGAGGLSRALSVVADIYLREKRKADQIANVAAEGQLLSGVNRLLYDPETGALNRKGKDAFGMPREVLAEYDRMAGEITAGMGNDEQRDTFNRLATMRRVEVERAAQRHTSGQITAYDKEVTDSYLTNERERVVNEYLDAGSIRVGIARQRQIIADYGKRNGKPPEWVETAQAEAVTQTHAGVLTRMLANGQDRLAQSYYNEHKGDMARGTVKANIEKALGVGMLLGEAQRRSDKIWSESPNLTVAQQRAREIADPKVRQETLKLVNQRGIEARINDKKRRDDNWRWANELVEKGQPIPPSLRVNLTGAENDALDARARHKLMGTEPVHNDLAWVDFLDMRPEELARMSSRELETRFRERFDNAHWERAAARWSMARDAARADPKAMKGLSAMLTNKQIIDNAYLQFVAPEGKVFDRTDSTQVRQRALLEGVATRAIEDLELTLRREATVTEKQKAIRGAVSLMATISEGGFMGFFKSTREVPAALVTEADKANATISMERIHPKLLEDLLTRARRLGVGQSNITDEQKKAELKDQLERAAYAAFRKASSEEIDAILSGGQ